MKKMTKVTTAHIPGGGPADKVCRECDHMAVEAWNPSGKPHQWCEKALEMVGSVDRARAKRLSGSTSACKYFQPRQTEAA